MNVTFLCYGCCCLIRIICIRLNDQECLRRKGTMSGLTSRSSSSTKDASNKCGSSIDTPPVTPAITRQKAIDMAMEKEGSLDNVDGTSLSNSLEKTSVSTSTSHDVSANRTKTLGVTGKPNQQPSLEPKSKRSRTAINQNDPANSNPDAAVLVDNLTSPTTRTSPRKKPSSASQNNQGNKKAATSSSSASKNNQGNKKATTSSSSSTTTTRQTSSNPTTLVEPGTYEDLRQFGNYT